MKKRLQQCFALCKLIIAFIIKKLFCQKIANRHIWLISEKLTEARDNGYHLFVYLRTNHPEIPVYFVIQRNSVDLPKIEKYGNVLSANTIKHYVYYLCALYSISSQPNGAAPEPKSITTRFRKKMTKNQRIIFLQHGITKDELPHSFDYSATHYSLFVCSSRIEQKFVEEMYKYPAGIVKNLGLCRFDYLKHNSLQKKRIVLVMPSFRGWLISKNTSQEASESEKERFVKSDYFTTYCSMLCNASLQDYLQSKGYKLVFYPHYAMQSFISCFKRCETELVTIADRFHYDVQKLLIESSCLITDYSSVFFDFAYMDKPEIFFQFDEDKYRSAHYKKGYFDYRENGFGPVFDNTDQVVKYLAQIIDNGCILEQKYINRINMFFDKRDDQNCARTFEAITSIKD